MNKTVNYIKNRLSLRSPQVESLNILADLADKLTLKKNPVLTSELEKVKNSYSDTFTDFERNFPSFCFSLATGVGKTRLMGAFITYLYIQKKLRNFLILAPNLTIYNKLIDDFSNINIPKYVFHGIGEFVHNQPRIITGDNYTYLHVELFETDVLINVFNISKINAETKGGKLPRIKRLSEYLGASYFNYLANLEDLVLLMDESHHYRADRGMEVINELNPILGLELTATPQVERSGKTIKFKNVVFEYSLAKAIRDGYVKEPAVATRKDFDPSKYNIEELDRIKLEDGIRIHEDTKVFLDIYSRDNNFNSVKPFVLIVAKDTSHANELKQLIISQSFFEGYYADKVMEIHSSQSGTEKDDNIDRLVSLEKPENKIEIVIHVNMLKEGWDVTNLYTIIPLRTASSMTLREQTIGRGLRLPYGKRTGQDKVDRLTIVAHDKFQEIIDEANKPDSIIKKENIIQVDFQELNQSKEVITSRSKISEKLHIKEKAIESIINPEEKEKARINLETHKTIISILPELNNVVKNINDLKKEEIKEIVIEKIKEQASQDLFGMDIVKEAKTIYESVVKDFTDNTIEIPRITIQQSNQIKSGFYDFDLDTKNLNFQPVSEEILIKKLREQENSLDIISGKGSIIIDTPENTIVNELINYSEIDYDEQAVLLFKLSSQSIEKFKTYLDDKSINNVVQSHKIEIARYIYSQMMEHFYFQAPVYETPEVKPFTKIEEHNFSKYTREDIYHFTDTIEPTNSIPSKVFSGFKKAYHALYKFDSKTEKDFARILEEDKIVLKWLKPALNQFSIYWNHNSKRYCPDFVVETEDTIYMIETKKADSIETSEVQEKAKAALEYCKNATEFTIKHAGKPWKYALIPHNIVMVNMSFEYLIQNGLATVPFELLTNGGRLLCK